MKRLAIFLATASVLVAPACASGEEPAEKPASPAAASAPPPDGDQSDAVRKAELLASPRWRRAMFELNEWLSTQKIYDEKQVSRIKINLNRQAATASSYDLEYLLEDLETKFKIMDTPEAREAREWLGQYLSVMSDRRREQVLKDVPDIVTMSASQLGDEIRRIEQKRASLQRQQSAFDSTRQSLAQEHMQTMRQQMTSQGATPAASFSPYRGGGGGGGGAGGGKPPFSDANQGGMTLYSGPFGAGVAINIGNF